MPTMAWCKNVGQTNDNDNSFFFIRHSFDPTYSTKQDFFTGHPKQKTIDLKKDSDPFL